FCFFFFQAEDGIRDGHVTGVQTCALPILTCTRPARAASRGVMSVKSAPPKRTSPAVTGSRPDSARSSVLLPAPLGPSSATTSPRSEERRVGKEGRSRESTED